jgi:recombinational DNA repair ATPase RecF
MPEPTLRDTVLKRLDAAAGDDNDWYPLVLAALEGAQELEKQLDEGGGAEAPASAARHPEGGPRTSPEGSATPRIAFLSKLTVEGFRGIGAKATLDLTPGPGLTLVVGRNGSGKSSFAEGLELLLTGGTYRWMKRSEVWKGGWRNLHNKQTSLQAVLAIEGEKGPCTLAREWPEGQELEDGGTTAQVHGKTKGQLRDLGWTDALASYRPFLSYNELGSMLDEGPSKLYDALAKILGLDDLVQAIEALQQERSARDKALKDADKERKDLVAKLAALTDERAKKAAAALQEKDDWGLDEVEAIVAGTAPGDAETLIDLLKRLAALPTPSREAIDAALGRLREAAERQQRAAQTMAAKADDLAAILDTALHFHDTHGDGACPVCGKPNALDGAWHQQKAQEAETLRQAAREATEARASLKTALAEVRRLVAVDSDLVGRAAALQLPAVAAAAKAVLACHPEGAAWKASHPEGAAWPSPEGSALAESVGPLSVAVEQLRRHAVVELQSREDVWRPFAAQIAQWLPRAKQARKAAEPLAQLKKAEKWLKDTAEDIRADRFAPIAEHATRIWDQLKLQSNVSLARIALKGDSKSTQRRVDLEVTVDGQEGAALGVMSQGELHSLALSLFIPRATLPASPFRFIVIDDPVQSMDPARVDGLARVLQEAAKGRQVLVFTHDDRLHESLRRLDIDATVIEVTRSANSQVSTRPALTPVARHIADAMALAQDKDLPPDIARRVIPGLCRQALEAACLEAVRRRRIGKGESHQAVEELLLNAQKLTNLAALALFDNPERAGDVMGHLNRVKGSATGDTFKACNVGAHGAFGGDPVPFVRDVEKLSRWLVTQ